VLVGRYPSDQPSARFDLASLKLPQEVPLSLPSRLVDQRPDVRAAEANMHSASALIGVAVAIIVAVQNLGATVDETYNSVNNALNN